MKNAKFLLLLFVFFSCTKDECGDREQVDLNPRIVKELNYKDLPSISIVDENGVEVVYNTIYDNKRTQFDAPFKCEEYLQVDFKNKTEDFFVEILSRASIDGNMLQISLPNQTKFLSSLQLIFDAENSFSLPSYNKDGKLTIHNGYGVDGIFFVGKVVEITYPETSPQAIKHFYFAPYYGIIRIENYAGESLSFKR